MSRPSIIERTIERTIEVLRHVPALLSIRQDKSPIDTVAALKEFVSTRSVYLAQKTLYGYVKTRMGIRYVSMFEDANIQASLNIAKHHVFAACLSDFAVFATAVSLRGQPVGNDERIALARQIYEAGIAENTQDAPEQFVPQDAVRAFAERAAATEWRVAAISPENFTASPQALYRWAPIADRLKKLDREVVENSVTFGWRDIREQFHKRLVADAVAADWTARASN
ncbi:MAG: hypothetical protein AB7O50_02610 [Pseudolabrys sp.]